MIEERFPDRIRPLLRRESEAADARTRALLVAGSYARGEARPGSDLDLYRILADGEPSTFGATVEGGVLVERTAFDAAAARRKIATNPMAWATFRDGVALIDDGIAADLRAECETAARAWRPDPGEIAGCAHWLRAAIVKVEAALDAGQIDAGQIDAERIERALWIVSTSTFELVRGLFLVNGRPIVAAGAAWRELGGLPLRPSETALGEILTAPRPEARARAFVSVARWTLARLEA